MLLGVTCCSKYKQIYTAVAGTLGVTGDVAVNTNKFTVAGASGNTAVAGDISMTGTGKTADFGGNAIKGYSATMHSMSANYTLTASDNGKIVVMDNGAGRSMSQSPLDWLLDSTVYLYKKELVKLQLQKQVVDH